MYFLQDVSTFSKHTRAFNNKVAYVLGEHKRGILGSGIKKKKVKNRKQAIAIALSEAKKDFGR